MLAGASDEVAMTKGFQQQDGSVNFSFPKSAPTQQNGGRADPKGAQPVRPERTFQPRPGH